MICEGDEVIIYANYKQMYRVVIKSGDQFQSKFGSVRHTDMIGKKYGTKIYGSKGYIYVLRPTAELLSSTSLHRTQILYPHDISLILLQLDLKPGKVLLEAGTGSGAMTRAALRVLQPLGELHTFELNAERFRAACQEFSDSQIVKLCNRNVCTDGFGMMDKADAVFLDLPAPWEVVKFAVEALRKNCSCRFASFSPCIEQTQKTCDELGRFGFTELLTVECVPRYYKVVDIGSSETAGKGVSIKQGSRAKKFRQSDEIKTTKTNDEKEDEISSITKEISTPEDMAKKLSFVPDPAEQPTHTGYLTFATLLPRFQQTMCDTDK